MASVRTLWLVVFGGFALTWRRARTQSGCGKQTITFACCRCHASGPRLENAAFRCQPREHGTASFRGGTRSILAPRPVRAGQPERDRRGGRGFRTGFLYTTVYGLECRDCIKRGLSGREDCVKVAGAENSGDRPRGRDSGAGLSKLVFKSLQAACGFAASARGLWALLEASHSP
jgi:hypothetical protein